MARVKFGDVVKEVKVNIDRATDTHEFYIAGEHMDSNNIHLTRRGEFAGSDVGPAFIRLFQPGQILYGSRRTYLKKVAVADFEGITSNTTFVLESKDETILLQGLLPFIMLSDPFTEYAIKYSKGSTNPYILFRDLAEYEFDLPDMSSQKKLLAYLQACDAVKESYKNLIQKTDEMVKSQFIEMFGDPVTNTQNRLMKPFSEFMDGIRYGTSQPPEFSNDGEYQFIRATNIKAGRIVTAGMLKISQEEADKIEKCKLCGGEIIIVRSGANTGDTCVVTEEYKDQYAGYDIIITLNQKEANPIFFNELLNTHYMQLVVKPLTARSAQPHINAKQVSNLPMLVVPIDEQNEFAKIVEQADKSKFELQQAIEKIDNLIKSLIQ